MDKHAQRKIQMRDRIRFKIKNNKTNKKNERRHKRMEVLGSWIERTNAFRGNLRDALLYLNSADNNKPGLLVVTVRAADNNIILVAVPSEMKGYKDLFVFIFSDSKSLCRSLFANDSTRTGHSTADFHFYNENRHGLLPNPGKESEESFQKRRKKSLEWRGPASCSSYVPTRGRKP